MLSMSTSACGSLCRIFLVACKPFIRGIAQSITITRGCNSWVRRMASVPSAASATTVISGSSSRMRRKPRRTRLWSSTNRTVILSRMGIQVLPGNLQSNQGSALRWPCEFHPAAQQLGAFAHGYQSNSLLRFLRYETFAMIFDFELKILRQKLQANPSLPDPGMPGDIIQRLLHDAIKMNGGIAVHRKRSSGFFIAYVNACLPFHHCQIPLHNVLDTGFVEHYGMKGLRQATHFFQSALCDFADFAQLGSQFGAFRRLIAGPAQHSADRSQDLSELVMQFTGGVAQRGFLGRD